MTAASSRADRLRATAASYVAVKHVDGTQNTYDLFINDHFAIRIDECENGERDMRMTQLANAVTRGIYAALEENT